MCSTPRPSLLISKVRSQLYPHRSMIYPWTRDQIQSSINSSLFGHSGKKGEKILRGSLHSVRGSIGLGLETLVIGSQAVYFCLFLAFITIGLCLCFYCFCLKLQYTFLLLIQSLYSMFVTISILCSIFLVLLDIDNMS